MGKALRRVWQSQPGVGQHRKDRRGCVYHPYVPDALVGRHLRLDADVAADVADAEAAIARHDASAATFGDTEALARLLLRAESIGSSRIEGLVIGSRRLLKEEAAQASGVAATDSTAREVLNNIAAMAWGVDRLQHAPSVATDGLLEIHRRLLTATALEEHAGVLRRVQNWIGGNPYNPCSAEFVPPPPELVADLLDDLWAFVNDDWVSPVVQAALAHAQFETIHPFVDGNGRTGRILIHVVLRRRGLAVRVVPPISLVLATRSQAYVGGLAATRFRGRTDSEEAHEGLNGWIAEFASACRRAVHDATVFAGELARIQDGWRAAVGKVRAGSALDLLINALPGAPLLSVRTAAHLIDRSFQATDAAMRRMEGAGVIRQTSIGRRNRAYEAPAVLTAFTSFERGLASPLGDTRVSPPVRPVPARPN